MISLGAVYGGPENKRQQVYSFISAVMQAFSKRFHDSGGPGPLLNIVFHVPGSISPEIPFVDLRTGSFFKKTRCLMVQAAVPAELVDSPDVLPFIFESLRGAVKLGAPYLKRKGLDYPEEAALAAIKEIELGMVH